MSSLVWTSFQTTINKWFHRPDFLALRACLATVKALDIETTPVWMMLIGPSSCGKSEMYLQSVDYERCERTSDLNLPGLLTMDIGGYRKGLLQRLGDKGLWIISDFSSVLSGREEIRNQVTSACREIFDGEYHRTLKGANETWKGRVNVIAACTPAIDSYYRVHADLGERFIQIQVERQPQSKELRRKANMQRQNKGRFRKEVRDAGVEVLAGNPTNEITPEADEKVAMWAEFLCRCRTNVSRNSYTGDITNIGYTEGAGRLYQEMLSLALGDASLFEQDQADVRQLDLMQRIAFDSLTRKRKGILEALTLASGGEMRRSDVQETSGVDHAQTFTRTVEDLVAIGIVESIDRGSHQTVLKFTPVIRKILADLLNWQVPQD